MCCQRFQSPRQVISLQPRLDLPHTARNWRRSVVFCLAVGMAGGLRAKGPKADLALIVADKPATAAGVFTTNVVCAAPVTFCRRVLAKQDTVRAVSTLTAQHTVTQQHCGDITLLHLATNKTPPGAHKCRPSECRHWRPRIPRLPRQCEGGCRCTRHLTG